MKSFSRERNARDVAVTILQGDRCVFSDPLCHALFDPASPPDIPVGQALGRLFEGKHPFLLFRRDFTLRKVAYTLYAAMPVRAEEMENPASLEQIAEEALSSLQLRFDLVLCEAEGALQPLSSIPLRSYFSSICSEICASLYAPLVVEVENVREDLSVRAHSPCLSQAIGLSLSQMLREGQCTLAFRLSEEDGVCALSFVGERGITSEFVLDLLDALADHGGFLVRHSPCGVHFHLLPSHRPAAILRAQDDRDDIHLREGFFLL
jgi:hypothetical protein